MLKTRTVIFIIILSALAVIFQMLPVFLSEKFILVTILSTFPVYILSRYNPRVGLFSYFVCGFLIMIFSLHEGNVFLLTNGLIGYFIGMGRHYIKGPLTVCIITSIILTATLGIMNYLAEIPALKISVFGGFVTQILFWYIFSAVYCFFCFKAGDFLYNAIGRLNYLEDED